MVFNTIGENLSLLLELNATENLIKRTGNTTETYKTLEITLEYDAILDADYAIMVNILTFKQQSHISR